MQELPGKADCLWTATAPLTHYERLRGQHRFDVVIVGAGIVGLTAALELVGGGRSVALVEARRIGQQVTGRSTAKITTQHSLTRVTGCASTERQVRISGLPASIPKPARTSATA